MVGHMPLEHGILVRPVRCLKLNVEKLFQRFCLVGSAAGSSNGRTPPSGGGYLGSNPGPAALLGSILNIILLYLTG